MNSDEKRGVERFRRVKDESVNIDDRLVDNSFEAKVSVHVARENFKFKKEKNMMKVLKITRAVTHGQILSLSSFSYARRTLSSFFLLLFVIKTTCP